MTLSKMKHPSTVYENISALFIRRNGIDYGQYSDDIFLLIIYTIVSTVFSIGKSLGLRRDSTPTLLVP